MSIKTKFKRKRIKILPKIHYLNYKSKIDGKIMELYEYMSSNDILDFITNKVKEKEQQQSGVTIDDIILKVSSYCGMSPSDLIMRTRKREIVQARQLAMVFGRMLTKKSLSDIGHAIGEKDHTTVLHSAKKVADFLETDKAYAMYFDPCIKYFGLSKIDIIKHCRSSQLKY